MSRLVMLLFVLPFALDAQGPPAPRSPVPAPAPAPAVTSAVTAAPAPAPVATPAPGTPVTDDEKTIYALGVLMQRSIRQFDLSPAEIEIVKRALIDAAAGTPAVDVNEWGPRIQPLGQARGLRVTAREKAASAVYLDNAATELGAVRTPSGLVYRDLAVGLGPSPVASDRVRVHYRGTLVAGTVFDSTYERSEPATFLLSGVVPCWTEGVQRMKVGGKARFVCPSDLAYGDAGAPTIPGGAALIFEVELLEIVTGGVFPRGN